ncbi:hypothetical protein NRY68_11710 [Acidithiobacillus ferrooxidans]|jgi:hypothetical protein|uniref:hypothetical protein n=1 Tax=Acidithiobacillus TaxID=119977 RepID=UPI002148B423|nr:hypothetical protein [Acidithiobacillus ferrooxidans]MCR1346421.1 hypothetical protein [Acidithiobacillus ferrooxidans]MCR1354902.1 hypothetical protein [Acidithiobacillus ferrooxidans]
MEPKRLTPRVARYVRAIEQARLEGYTWDEIFDVLSSEVSLHTWGQLRQAFLRAQKAMADGRLSPQQIPLPKYELQPETRSNFEAPAEARDNEDPEQLMARFRIGKKEEK